MTKEIMMNSPYCIVIASNDAECLKRNIMASDMVKNGIPVHVETGAPSASIAYNRGLAATEAPIVIFAHQDVYFPPGWEVKLDAAIAAVEKQDPNWSLIAPFGVTKAGQHVGEVWSTSLSRVVGQPMAQPERVESFDELVIVMRRDSGLQFDENLPNYHLYGTDIIQMAHAKGGSAWVASLPLVHNDGFHDHLRADFRQSYHFTRRKWRKNLPLRTPVLWLRWHGLSLAWVQFRHWRSVEARRKMAADPSADPRVFSKACGWETTTDAGA